MARHFPISVQPGVPDHPDHKSSLNSLSAGSENEDESLMNGCGTAYTRLEYGPGLLIKVCSPQASNQNGNFVTDDRVESMATLSWGSAGPGRIKTVLFLGWIKVKRKVN